MNLTKEERMGSGSIPGLILAMSVPSIIAQVINVLYNIVDRIYIGHIPGVGSAALTGVGLTFPIAVLISAFSAFSSAGGTENSRQQSVAVAYIFSGIDGCFLYIPQAVFVCFWCKQ